MVYSDCAVITNSIKGAERITQSMARRGLLTDKERDVLLGDQNVTDNYYYTVVSRVREKIERVDEDMEALEKHGQLAQELRDVVCKESTDKRDQL